MRAYKAYKGKKNMMCGKKYEKKVKQGHKPAKTCYLVSLACFGVFSIPAIADEALMKPVQEIHFQELPPPWASEPIPNIDTPKNNVVTQKEKVRTQSTKPVKKHIARQDHLKPVVRPSAPKLTTIQSLISAANKNNHQAQYDLGMRYQYGNGVQKSRSSAHRWLNKSAKSGNARAQYALSLFYQQYARNQQGIKKSLFWLKSAADQGFVDAQYSLGMMFKNGSLVHNDQVEARKWLKMAASKGHVSALLALK